MTISKIEEKINDYILKTGSDPGFMVIHPKTFSNLIRGLTGVNPLDSTGFMQYRGMRVYRSLDIDEGEIEI